MLCELHVLLDMTMMGVLRKLWYKMEIWSKTE
jgi:hypothetical protein